MLKTRETWAAALDGTEMGQFRSGAITHVSLAILAKECVRPCDVCSIKGLPSRDAAYTVHNVWVCRKHLAQVIDAASRRTILTTAEENDPTVSADVTTLVEGRKNRDRAKGSDLLRKLEQILAIPENPPDC